MRPVLYSGKLGPQKISDVVAAISDDLNLTDAEREEMLPSGKQTKIANRVHWARSYLKQAGLVRNPKRGWFEITERGRGIADDQSIEINKNFLGRVEIHRAFVIAAAI